jgi:hypothetical protein
MRINRIKNTSRPLAAAALAATAAVAGVVASGPAAASVATAPAALHHPAATGLDLRGLTLVLNWQIVTGLTSTGGPRVGTDTNYNISIYAADGTLLGTQQGNSLISYIDPTTGDIYVHQRDVVNIAGGSFVDSGVVDASASYRGVQQTLFVQGVSGTLTGDFGVYQDTVVAHVLPPHIWQASADIELTPSSALAGDTGLPSSTGQN